MWWWYVLQHMFFLWRFLIAFCLAGIICVFPSLRAGWSQSQLDQYFWDGVPPSNMVPILFSRFQNACRTPAAFGMDQDEISRLFVQEAHSRIPSAQDVTVPSGLVDSKKSCFQYMCHSQVAPVTPCPSLKSRPSGNWRSGPKRPLARGSWGSSHRMDVP